MEKHRKKLRESLFTPNSSQMLDMYDSIQGDSIFGNYINFLKYSNNYLFIGNEQNFAIIDRVSTLIYRIKFITSNNKNLLKDILYFSSNKNIYGLVPFSVFSMAINSGFQTLEFNSLKNVIKNVISKFEQYYLVPTLDSGIKFNNGSLTKKYFFICNNKFIENIYY